jgi:hypothetical protein
MATVLNKALIAESYTGTLNCFRFDVQRSMLNVSLLMGEG